MDQLIITCMNCGNSYEGDFCPSCGQSAKTGKLTWKSLLTALLHAFDFEHGVLHVFRELLLRPRQLILGYIGGKRMNVYPPLKYMLLSIALTTALHFLYNDEDLGLGSVMVNGVEQQFNLWTSTNLSLFHLIVLPFCALSTRLFFKQWKLTLPEHFVLNMFVLGQMNLVEFIILGVLSWVPSIVGYSSIISLIIPGYIYFMMCKPRTVGSLVRAIAASFLSMIAFMTTITVLTVVVMVITNGALGLTPVAP